MSLIANHAGGIYHIQGASGMTKSHNLPALQELKVQGGNTTCLNPNDSKLER